MAVISPTTAWQNVTLTTDEIWSPKGGSVLVASSDDANEGIPLSVGQAVKFDSGVTVYYKAAGPTDDLYLVRLETSL